MPENSSGGIGISTFLGILFIVLKLTDNIDWSWWWVLSPFWIPWAIFLSLMLLYAVFFRR